MIIKQNNLPELKRGHWCYYIPAVPNKNGHYFVGIVIEGEPDYYLTDWDYGTDGKFAAEVVVKMNQDKLGLSERDTYRIVCSSMFQKTRLRGVQS